MFRENSGVPNVTDFRKISVRKTICDLEFSEHLLQKFLFACLSQDFLTSTTWYDCPFLTDFYPKRSPELSGALFLAEIFEKVSFDPYNFWITRLSTRKSEQMKKFQSIKYAYIYRLNTNIRLTSLCLSGFELDSRWVSLKIQEKRFLFQRFVMSIVGLYWVHVTQVCADRDSDYWQVYLYTYQL